MLMDFFNKKVVSFLDFVEKSECIKIKQFLFPLVFQTDYLVTILCIFHDHLTSEQNEKSNTNMYLFKSCLFFNVTRQNLR